MVVILPTIEIPGSEESLPLLKRFNHHAIHTVDRILLEIRCQEAVFEVMRENDIGVYVQTPALSREMSESPFHEAAFAESIAMALPVIREDHLEIVPAADLAGDMIAGSVMIVQ